MFRERERHWASLLIRQKGFVREEVVFRVPGTMASVKSKAGGANNESSPYRESARASAGSPSLVAGAASLSLTSSKAYSLDDFDTIATVGRSIGYQIVIISIIIIIAVVVVVIINITFENPGRYSVL